MFDFVVVGSGLSGSTCARLLAEKGKKVLVVEKRNHIAGNAYDYYNESMHLIHMYGPHIFHTRFKEVWDFLSLFTKWMFYQHRVKAYVNGMLVPMPINLDTINLIYGANYSAGNISDFYETIKVKCQEINNAKDMVVSKIGQNLYELFFMNYTKKQWNLRAEELDKEVTARIPIRLNRDDRYFDDLYQGMPVCGYTAMIQNMLSHKNISILLNTDYKELVGELKYQSMIYTGPIDYFFDYCHGKLGYRSLRFEMETINQEFFQAAAVVNYPNDYEFTRITEFKHMTGQQSSSTTIMREYPTDEGEPYYPIPVAQNREIYNRYYQETLKLTNVYFLGRLGQYKYANMDIVVKNAMELVNKID